MQNPLLEVREVSKCNTMEGGKVSTPGTDNSGKNVKNQMKSSNLTC
jgi:hypothetical protein